MRYNLSLVLVLLLCVCRARNGCNLRAALSPHAALAPVPAFTPTLHHPTIQVLTSAVLIPSVSRTLDENTEASFTSRFQRRVGLATLLSAIGFVVAPIGIVAVVDPRCLNYWLFPPDDTTTEVGTTYCSLSTTTNGRTTCREYATDSSPSTYSYDFAYSGEQCGE